MDIATLVPAGGLASVIVLLVGYLLRQIVSDRADYRAQIVAEQQRTAAAEARTDAERVRAREAQIETDAERKLRRAAEAEAAVATSRLATQKQILDWYERQPLAPTVRAVPDAEEL